MTKLSTIDVCIATYKRPILLSNLLTSIARQTLDGIRLRIIVIDNDQEQSAHSVVKAFKGRNKIELIYDVEPQKNIALARNRALQHVTAEYLVFVDDDETVSRTWLSALLKSLTKYSADVAFGPVTCILPANAPTWAERLFKRAHYQTGEQVSFGGAGNVMMRRRILKDLTAYFNPDFGLTGGEDTEFFYRLHLMNKRLIWCDEAAVDEYVPMARVSLQWIRMRGYRSGQTYNRIVVSRYSVTKKCVWFLTKVLQFSGGLLIAPFLRLFSYSNYVALTVRIAAAAGQLSRCFSANNFEEYKV